MGVSKSTQDQSGFEYAMAVMKMCDILHLRHTKIWLRPDLLFKLTDYAKKQTKLLDVIHGLTKKVILQSPSLLVHHNNFKVDILDSMTYRIVLRTSNWYDIKGYRIN